MRGDGGRDADRGSLRARDARRCAAHRARVPGSPSSLARRSASEEAGRWSRSASRSSRARTSRAAGRRRRASGERAAAPASANSATPTMRKDARRKLPDARARRPQETATPTASATTSGGQTRSTRSARRAKVDSEPAARRRRADWWFFRIAHRDAMIRRWRFNSRQIPGQRTCSGHALASRDRF